MITPGLERITHLLAGQALPWRAVHVAGTNGKGSICAYISHMLDAYNDEVSRAADAKTHENHCGREHGRSKASRREHLVYGRFTSPHLVDRWDGISINGSTVLPDRFKATEKTMMTIDQQHRIGASEFEILTATAFAEFTHSEVDVAVVEVGMGGALDATNIIGVKEGTKNPAKARIDWLRPPPLVTVISSIGLDHQAFLGSTLKEIAQAKAGIIKPGVPVVYDDTNPTEVIEEIEAIAAANGSPIADWDRLEAPSASFGAETRRYLDELVEQYILPPHTKQNLTLAFLATWKSLQQLERLPFSEHDVNRTKLSAAASAAREELARKMLEVVFRAGFPGRQQSISIEPLTGRKEIVLLDGAHNAQSAQALATLSSRMRRPTELGSITWVLAASDSKDVKEILAPLLRNRDRVVAVEFGPVDGMPWVKPLKVGQLLEAAKAVVSEPKSLSLHPCGQDVLAALRVASEKAGGGPLVIAGSLYLVGDVLRLVRDA